MAVMFVQSYPQCVFLSSDCWSLLRVYDGSKANVPQTSRQLSTVEVWILEFMRLWLH